MTPEQFQRWIWPTVTRLVVLCKKHNLPIVLFIPHGSKPDKTIGFPDGVKGGCACIYDNNGRMPRFMQEAKAELTFRRKRRARRAYMCGLMRASMSGRG